MIKKVIKNKLMVIKSTCHNYNLHIRIKEKEVRNNKTKLIAQTEPGQCYILSNNLLLISLLMANFLN